MGKTAGAGGGTRTGRSRVAMNIPATLTKPLPAKMPKAERLNQLRSRGRALRTIADEMERNSPNPRDYGLPSSPEWKAAKARYDQQRKRVGTLMNRTLAQFQARQAKD